MHRGILLAFVLSMALAACKGAESESPTAPTATTAMPDKPTLTATKKPINATAPTAAAMTTLTPEPMTIEEATVTPTDDPNRLQVVENSSFDANISGWKRPYGTFSHMTSEYQTAPGAGRLVTTGTPGGLDYLATIGQCIDLRSHLDNWPETAGHKYLTIEAYLQTNESIAGASLNGIFSDDSRCGPGHVGNLGTSAITGSQAWTRVTSTVEIPGTTKSIHVFVWATGTDASGSVYIDDVLVYSPDAATAVP